MSHKNPQKNSPFFRTAWSGKLLQIIAVSVVFHLLIVAAVIGLNQIHFERPPEAVKVFQLVQVQSPKPVKPAAPRPKPQPPKPEPPKTEPKKELPKPKPEIKKELPPEPKIAEEKPKPVEPPPEPAPEPEEVHEEETMNLPDDMNLPEEIAEESGLNPVGYVDMDPLMQVYLELLKQRITENFRPPQGLNVSKSTKTSVQFTVDRFGKITNISLKRSSGNRTWDHLSMRAVQRSTLPPLPANYREPALSLKFNFTPN